MFQVPLACRPWLLVICLAGPPAGASAAASYPVRPRPQCEHPPPQQAAQLQREGAACRGPLYGARAGPKRHPGRQQYRMRDCQTRAGWQGLRGTARATFLRHCLHRGG